MSRIVRIAPAVIGGLLAASFALAQTGSTTTTTQGQSTADASTQPAQVTTTTNASANTTTQVDPRQAREQIEKRAAKVSAQAKTKAEAQLSAAAEAANQYATVDGDAAVAARLAADFNMTADALTAERKTLDASWGQLMIAHTLAANTTTGVTAEQLIGMNKDGMGWGQIAAGLGLQLGSVVSSVNAEGRVAHGLEKADGRVAAMRGVGARGNAGVNAGLGVQAGKAGVNAGAGLGVKINR